MKILQFLLLSVCAACLLAGIAAAETRMSAPSAGIMNATLLPLNVSGLSVCPGVEFELRYDPAVITINGFISGAPYRGTISIVPNINNAAGFARIIVLSTSGITAPEPATLLMINVSVNGTGYTPLQLQNAKWVWMPTPTDFISVAFDTATSGLITTNGATVPVAAVVTTLPPVPPQAIAPPAYPQYPQYPHANPTELPTLDLPPPSGTSAPVTQASPVISGTTTAPAPERTLVLFSPTETGAAATPAGTTSPPATQAAQPAETQKSPGFSWPGALAASGLGAVAVFWSRKV